MRETVSKGRLGELANAAGFYPDRLHNSRVRTGELWAARLVDAGMAEWVGNELLIYGGTPRTTAQARELMSALKAAEAMREPKPDPFPTAHGRALDMIVFDHWGIGRNVGETDAELRARVMRNWPA